MPSFLEVNGYLIRESTFHAVADRYQAFRGTDEHRESYKWDIQDKLATWFDEHTLDGGTVPSFAELVKDVQPGSGALVDWRQLGPFQEFVEEDPGRASEALQGLWDEQAGIELEGRIRTFREAASLGSDCIGFLLWARHPDRYAPFKSRMFNTFLELVSEGEVPSPGSVAEKLATYHRFLERISEFLSKEGYVPEAGPLDAQDLMYSITQYDQPKYDAMLAMLHGYSKELGGFREDTEGFLDAISDLPRPFLEEERELYEGRSKVAGVRGQLLEILLAGGQADLGSLIEQENAKFEKDVFRNWSEFTVLGKLYTDLFGPRMKRYMELLAEGFAERLELHEIKSHVVGFEGSANYPSTDAWLALYPVEADEHREAYQLFFRVKPGASEVGLWAGSFLREQEGVSGEVDVREVDPEDLSYSRLLEHLSEVLPEYRDRTSRSQSADLEEPLGTEPVFEELAAQLKRWRQVILHGPPGTGKTYLAQRFARWWCQQKTGGGANLEEQVRMVTFHPSFSYEDFVEGLTAEVQDGALAYEIKPGALKRIADAARAAYEQVEDGREAPPYILIIDEINRGNLPRILGESITLLEGDKRLDRKNQAETELAHSGQRFVLPPNLFLVGTMNTADRSIALIDAAIRRRFGFLSLPPDYQVLIDHFGFETWADVEEATTSETQQKRHLQALSLLALRSINTSIREAGSLGKGKQIGHAYLLGGSEVQDLVSTWRYRILPLIEEYYFGQYQRIQQEVFAGGGTPLFDWDREEICGFGADELLEGLRELAGLQAEVETDGEEHRVQMVETPPTDLDA